MERFLDALWGEIARRKAVCDNAGVDDAKEYNEMRSRMRARGQDIPPLPMLVVVIDEFYEWFRIMPTAVDVLDSIGRQGRAYWIHLMMASQTIESRAEKLMENMGYRLVLKARTAGAAQAAGVPNAVNLPAQAGLGYFRKSLDEIVRFQARVPVARLPPRHLLRRRRPGVADPHRGLHSATTVYHRVHADRGRRHRTGRLRCPHQRRQPPWKRRGVRHQWVRQAGRGSRARSDPDAEGRYRDHRPASPHRLQALPVVAAAAGQAGADRVPGRPFP